MSLNALEIRHIRYFVAVAEEGAFRRAALRLHVSQPPLTRQIQQLEDILGVTLFVRKPRGVELTEAGQVFLTEARNILALIDRSATLAQLAARGQIGRLDVGIFGSAVFGAIPAIIRKFRARYPDVEVELHNMDRASQIKALRERRLTVGFNRFFTDEPGLAWEPIQTERMLVALPQTHALAGKSALSLRQLSKEDLILYPRRPRPSFIDEMLAIFHKKAVTPKSTQEVDDVITAIALVASGFGISLVTEAACNLRLPGIAYVPLRPADRVQFDLCMIYRDDDGSALLKAFLDTVRGLSAASGQP